MPMDNLARTPISYFTARSLVRYQGCKRSRLRLSPRAEGIAWRWMTTNMCGPGAGTTTASLETPVLETGQRRLRCQTWKIRVSGLQLSQRVAGTAWHWMTENVYGSGAGTTNSRLIRTDLIRADR